MLYRHCFSTLLYSTPLRGAKEKKKQVGLGLNGTYQLLICPTDVNLSQIKTQKHYYTPVRRLF
jgi:hypothetical protein